MNRSVDRTTQSAVKAPRLRQFLVGIALLVCTATATAHHSYAVYDDLGHRVTVHGVVQDIQWVNPHVTLSIACDGKDGRRIHTLEGTSPLALVRALGGNKRAIQIGDEITVEYAPLKSGERGGVLARIVRVDGQVLVQVPAFRHATLATQQRAVLVAR